MTMTHPCTLLERTFVRTTRKLLDTYGVPAYAGYELEAWVFDDQRERQATEAAFKELGVRARLRSAYKPLVHFFLENFCWESLEALAIRYPCLERAPQRFLLEAYPLAALIPEGVAVNWERSTGKDFQYRVVATRVSGKQEIYDILAPNREHKDHVGEPQCSPCGWLRLKSPAGEQSDMVLDTDFEALFQAAMGVLSSTDWGRESPYFEELYISVQLPARDRRLAWADEHISLAEALHEELYFSTLEYFQRLAGLALGDRSIQPGQIVPEIVTQGDTPALTMRLQPLDRCQPEADDVVLDKAPHAIGRHQIDRMLAGMKGQRLEARTRSGRTVQACYRAGEERSVLISAGQHANEASGVVGALRALQQLEKRESAHYVISPLENPDGYALFSRLTATQPRHMHHAARYTAFGNDLQNQPPGQAFEHAIREQAIALSHAQLHINLHGYPAHEWTRPLNGYIPRGFDMWTIPKGFFLILRHHPGWQGAAEQLVEKVTASLAQSPERVAFNADQIRLFETHAGKLGFPVLHGFPYLIMEDPEQLTPLMLITEYPDETLTGEPFIQAHGAQMATVISAYQAFQTLSLPIDNGT